MRRYLKSFQLPLTTGKSLVGWVKIEVDIKVTEDGIKSWDVYDVTPMDSKTTTYGLMCWAYENKSLEELITPIVEGMEESLKEEFSDDEFEEEREHNNMEETYKSLNRQFIHP